MQTTAISAEKVLYENLLPHEFIQRINAFPVAYLPLGTLEWHGKHLPLGSDGLQSKGIFQRLAMKVGGIVLPMLFLGPDCVSTDKSGNSYYGMDNYSFESSYAQQLIGSAYYIDDQQFDTLLDRVIKNLARAQFKIVVAHGHGPSNKAFAARAELFKAQNKLLTYTLWDLGLTGKEGIMTDHAAANETSLVMALNPELVDISRIADDQVPLSIWGADPRTEASATKGAQLIDINISIAAQKLQDIVAQIELPHLSLDYHHQKNLLDN